MVASDWKKNWETETKRRHKKGTYDIYKGRPPENVLEILEGVQKGLSSLIVQMRTGKIELRKLLYE